MKILVALLKHSAMEGVPNIINQALPSLSKCITKSQIGTLVDKCIRAVLEQGDTIAFVEHIKALEEFVHCVRKDDQLTDSVRDEVINHNGRITTASGSRIELCEAGTKYDFSQDAEWTRLQEEIDDLSALQKQREQVLRFVKEGKMAVDEETGELLVGPSKTSKSGYKITLAK
jgi:hypothetical protein